MPSTANINKHSFEGAFFMEKIMDSALIGTIITQIGAILIASGGWYFAAKRDREKTREAMKSEIQDLRNDVTSMGANLQQKIAVIELELGHTRNDISALSTRVEKHNGVVERTSVLEEKVKVANARIADLEDKDRKGA